MQAPIDLEERETRWVRRGKVRGGKRRWIEGGKGTRGDGSGEKQRSTRRNGEGGRKNRGEECGYCDSVNK